MHVSSTWAFQLVNDSLAWSRAENFCRSHFSWLVVPEQLEASEGLRELLEPAGVRPPLWLGPPGDAAPPAGALARQRE